MMESYLFMFKGLQNNITGPNGKGMQLHIQVPTHAILKTHVWLCCTPEILYDLLSQLFLIHLISTRLIFLIKSSVLLYSTFYLLFFFHKVTFSYSCSYYLLATLRQFK